MKLNEYQEQAMSTCLPACENLPYMLFNLQGEVGELSSKIAKAIRKGDLFFCDLDDQHNQALFRGGFTTADEVDLNNAIKGELGDILWQLSGVCSVLGFDLENVAKHNLKKLASRKQRGVIDGDGDNR